jgi:hypothetical protein
MVFIKNGQEIYKNLHVKDEDAVTGKFKNFAEAQYGDFNQLSNSDQLR